MSEIIEKTLAALPNLISPLSAAARGARAGVHSPTVPRGFQNFVKSVMDARSHSEEEKVVRKDLKYQQNLLSQPNISRSQLYDSMLRMVYCHLIGYDVSFAYVEALKLTQRGSTTEKLLGYFAVSVFLHDEHDLLVLLVNTLQKDLKSTNIIENCCSLVAICKLLNADMAPTILPSISNLLKHSRDSVRMKAVIALHYISRKAPSFRKQLRPLFHTALCDRQPSVMAATLPYYMDLVLEDVSGCTDLVPVLVNILEQTIRHKLPGEMEYHRVPAPWLQIQILKILAILGTNNPSSSEKMYAVLEETLQKSDSTQTISQAILYECILTIATVSTKVPLLDKAAKYVGRLLNSGSLNIKYVGLQALSALVHANPLYSLDHQIVVIESLDSEDTTIVTQTLNILFKIATKDNIEAISDRLTHCLTTSHSRYFSDHIINRALSLIETHSHSLPWFFQHSHRLLLATGESLRLDAARRVLDYIIAESSAREPMREFQLSMFECYMEMLKSGLNLPRAMMYMITWVIGEYSYLSPAQSRHDDAVRLLADKFRTDPPGDGDVRWWILSAILKLVPRCSKDHPALLAMLREGEFRDMRLVQLMSEIRALLKDPELVEMMLVSDTNITDLSQVDTSLSFADTYVVQMMEEGCEPYKPKHLRQRPQATLPEVDKLFSGVNFESYHTPMLGGASPGGGAGLANPQKLNSSGESVTVSSGSSPNNDFNESVQGLQLGGVKQVWGRQGRIQKSKSPPQPPSTAPASQHSNLGGEPEAPSDPPGTKDVSVSVDEDRRQNLASALFRGLQTHSSQGEIK